MPMKPAAVATALKMKPALLVEAPLNFAREPVFGAATLLALLALSIATAGRGWGVRSAGWLIGI